MKIPSAPPRSQPSPLELSLVMPVYNEASQMESLAKTWIHFLREHVGRFEMIIVNDGSSDGTGRILDALRKEFAEVRVFHQLHVGRTHAIRKGYEAVRGRFTLQVDSNGRYLPEDLLCLWPEREKYITVLAGRTHRLEAWPRRVLSHLQTRLVRWLFKIELRDPNVPFRLFHTHVLRSYLHLIPPSILGLNLRLSLLAALNHPRQIAEVPIPYRMRPSGRSHEGFLGLLSRGSTLFFELVGLRLKLFRVGVKPTGASIPQGA